MISSQLNPGVGKREGCPTAMHRLPCSSHETVAWKILCWSIRYREVPAAGMLLSTLMWGPQVQLPIGQRPTMCFPYGFLRHILIGLRTIHRKLPPQYVEISTSLGTEECVMRMDISGFLEELMISFCLLGMLFLFCNNAELPPGSPNAAIL